MHQAEQEAAAAKNRHGPVLGCCRGGQLGRCCGALLLSWGLAV